MKDGRYIITALLLIALPLAVLAKGEADDWAKAQKKGTIQAYDEHLKNYPRGTYSEQAKREASRLSGPELQNSASRCDSLFPRVFYYSVSASGAPVVSGAAVSSSLDKAAGCMGMAKSIGKDDRPHAAAGLLDSRSSLVQMNVQGVGVREVINLDLVLLEIENEVIMDAYDETVKCKNQSAWVDTPKSEVFKCSRPHQEVQARMAQAMSDQLKYDFANVSSVPDENFRMGFWKEVNGMCRWLVLEQMGPAFGLYADAKNAMAREPNKNIAGKIEDVSIKLAGTGKPTGGFR